MKRILKYVGIGFVVIAIVLSISFNVASFYKGYANSLRVEGYNEAMQLIDATLAQQGKLDLTRRKPDGTLEQITLIPQNKGGENKEEQKMKK